jgi:hypothetical protein
MADVLSAIAGASQSMLEINTSATIERSEPDAHALTVDRIPTWMPVKTRRPEAPEVTVL